MRICHTVLDVVAVSDCNGNVYSTEFHVNFEDLILDYTTISILGIHTRRNHLNQGRAFSSLVESREKTVSIPPLPNESGSYLSTQPLHNINPEIEPEWCDIFCNDQKCPEINAFVGPDNLLTFLECTLHRGEDYVGLPTSQFTCASDNRNAAGRDGSDELLLNITDSKEELLPSKVLTRKPSPSTLRHLHLIEGQNKIVCKNRSSGTTAEFSVFLYARTDKIIIMDIDGTVTRSDVRGYIESVYFGTYDYTHEGIVAFSRTLKESSNCHFLYLTSRPISHIKETRLLLLNAKDSSTKGAVAVQRLPMGPVFSNTETSMAAAYRELISKDTVAFKSSTLLAISSVFQRAIEAPAGSFNPQLGSKPHDTICITDEVFCESSHSTPFSSPFLFGIGNKIADAIAYKIAGVSDGHILVIDTDSNIRVWVDDRSVSPCTPTSSMKSSPNIISVTSIGDNVLQTEQINNDDKHLISKEIPIMPHFQSYSDPSLISYLQRLACTEKNEM